MMSTSIEIATVVLWLIKPSAASPSKINRVVSNMPEVLAKIKENLLYSTHNRVNKQALIYLLQIRLPAPPANLVAYRRGAK